MAEPDFIALSLHGKAYNVFVFVNHTVLSTEHRGTKGILHMLWLWQTLWSLGLDKHIASVKGFAHVFKTHPFISITNACLLVKKLILTATQWLLGLTFIHFHNIFVKVMDQKCLPIIYPHWEWILEAHKNAKHLHLLGVWVAPALFQRKSNTCRSKNSDKLHAVFWIRAVRKHYFLHSQVCFRWKFVQLALPVHSLAYTSFDYM